MKKLKLDTVIHAKTLNQVADILIYDYGFDDNIKNRFTGKNYQKNIIKNKYSLWMLNYSDWNEPKVKPEHVQWTNYISSFDGGYEITEMWHNLEDPQMIKSYNDNNDLRITFAKDPKRNGYVFLGIVKCTNIGLQIGNRKAKTYSTFQKDVIYKNL